MKINEAHQHIQDAPRTNWQASTASILNTTLKNDLTEICYAIYTGFSNKNTFRFVFQAIIPFSAVAFLPKLYLSVVMMRWAKVWTFGQGYYRDQGHQSRSQQNIGSTHEPKRSRKWALNKSSLTFDPVNTSTSQAPAKQNDPRGVTGHAWHREATSGLCHIEVTPKIGTGLWYVLEDRVLFGIPNIWLQLASKPEETIACNVAVN